MKIYLVDGDWSQWLPIWGVIPFLWRPGVDYDSDGSECSVEDPCWMEMFFSNRETEAGEEESVGVGVAQEEPRVVEVDCEANYLCARTAYFLAHLSGSKISFSLAQAPQDLPILLPQMGDFDVEVAFGRAGLRRFWRTR